nr:putative reverse transcriptase domain-containing protein [Tanacetum cinerariifolium]
TSRFMSPGSGIIRLTYGPFMMELWINFPLANVVADALTRKERVKPKRVRAMNMTLQSCIKDRILITQNEDVNEFVGLQKGLDEMINREVLELCTTWIEYGYL